MVNFELGCELIRRSVGFWFPLRDWIPNIRITCCFFHFFSSWATIFSSSSWNYKVLAIKLEDKTLVCETISCLSCCARWFWLASLWITPNVWSYRAVLCYGAFILLCKVVLVAHKTLRFDRYVTVTSDNIRIQRLVHQIKSFISGRRMSNQLKYW